MATNISLANTKYFKVKVIGFLTQGLPSLRIFLALRVYFFFSVTDVGENLYKQTSMGAAYVRIHLKLELKGPSALRELTSSFSHSVS